MHDNLFLFWTLLLLFGCQGRQHKFLFSAVNLILKSYQANFVTIYNPCTYLGVDIVGNIKLTTQAITVVNNFRFLPLRCKNGPCPTKRRSHFGKVLLFFPSLTNSIVSYYTRVKYNKEIEEHPVTIFLIYPPETMSVPHFGWNRHIIMDIVYAAVFIILVDKDWSPTIRSDVNKITIYCTNCKYCSGKNAKSIVPFDSTTDDFKATLWQAQILGFDNGYGIMWKPKERFGEQTDEIRKRILNSVSLLAQEESIHPFLKGPSFPTHFSPVLHILLLNFTKHGLHNYQSLRRIWSACNNEVDADYSHYLALDVGKLLNRPSYYFHAHFVMLRQYGFDFITCSGVHLKNDLNAFIRPFDWITWTCVIITISFVVALASSNNRMHGFMYTFGALIEQSNAAFVNIFEKKWYCLPILLGFLTISGAYKGKILQFLVLPRQYERTVTRIKEMTNFTFFSTQDVFFFNRTFSEYPGFLELSEFQEVYTTYLETREEYNQRLLDKVKYLKFSPTPTDSFNYMVQRGYDFVKHCNKTAYAGLMDSIDDNLDTANEMGKEDNVVFMKGTDNFGLTGEFVLFDPHLDGIMAHRLQRLIDTGVYSIWQKWIDISYKTAKKSASNICRKPLTLNSDLFSLFSTVLAVYVFASLIFCAENALKLCKLGWCLQLSVHLVSYFRFKFQTILFEH